MEFELKNTGLWVLQQVDGINTFRQTTIIMKDKLAICLIGYQNSGKSSTLYHLFESKVRISAKRLWLNGSEENDTDKYVSVQVANGSPQESGVPIGDKISNSTHPILICSLQYYGNSNDSESIFDSFDWLETNGYTIYGIWLNPGWEDNYPYFDYLGLTSRIHKNPGNLLCRVDANHGEEVRGRIIRELIYGWAALRGLVY